MATRTNTKNSFSSFFFLFFFKWAFIFFWSELLGEIGFFGG